MIKIMIQQIVVVGIPSIYSRQYWDIYKYVRYSGISMSSVEELFDDSKKMGSIFILAALVSIILAILGIITGVFLDVNLVWVIMTAIGAMAFAYLLHQFGVELRDNSADKVLIPFITNFIGPFIDHSHSLTRVSIFAGLVRLAGIGMIVYGIFNIIGTIFGGYYLSIGTGVFVILIGFVFLWASREISIGGNHSFMWILLLILFILSFLASLFLLFSGLIWLNIATAAGALILLVISGYAIYLVLSSEVKSQMGA